MEQEKNWAPNTKKALEEASKFSKKTQQDINKKAQEPGKASWVDAANEILGGIANGASHGSSGGY